MNCHDIDQILNRHSMNSLGAAQRSDFDSHITVCGRCSTSAHVYELLASESSNGPRPGFFESTIRRIGDAATTMTGNQRPRRWPTVGGIAALAAIALFAVLITTIRTTENYSDGSRIAAVDAAQITALSRPENLYIEGEHFSRLPFALPIGNFGAKITVVEFFMYPCNWCYELEPRLSEWATAQNRNEIEVLRIPVQWNARAGLQARAFFAAEVLNASKATHAAFFEEIHENGNLLNTRQQIETLFLSFGIPKDEFDEAFDSLEVEANLERARDLANRYQINSAPSIVVAGTYVTSAGMAGSYDNLFGVMDWLIDEARALK